MEYQRNSQLTKSISLFLMLSVFTIVNIYGQFAQEDYSLSVEKETNLYNVKSFTVKEINNTAYFKFLIVENDDNAVYVLESSINGVDFIPVNLKEGFKSPNNTPLLYCFSINKESNVKGNYYRVKRKSLTEEVFSDILSVEGDYQEFASQTPTSF